MDPIVISLWEEQRGDYFCVSSKTKDEHWHDFMFPRGEWGNASAYLACHFDDHLYFCPHGFYKPRRLKENAAPSHYLWADLDETDPRTLDLRSTTAWQSSKRRYAASWRCNGVPSDGLRKGFNIAVGGDAGGYVITKVLRLPGTRNYKYDPPPLVKWLWIDGPTYELKDLEQYAVDVPHIAPIDDLKFAHIDPEEVLSRRKCRQFLLNLKHSVLEPYRSSVIWKVGKTLQENGATEAEVAAVVNAMPAFQDKHRGDRRALLNEVARIFAK